MATGRSEPMSRLGWQIAVLDVYSNHSRNSSYLTSFALQINTTFNRFEKVESRYSFDKPKLGVNITTTFFKQF